jgi:hypothetical protein
MNRRSDWLTCYRYPRLYHALVGGPHGHQTTPSGNCLIRGLVGFTAERGCCVSIHAAAVQVDNSTWRVA